MFCSKCGTKITDNSIFCYNCGFKIKNDNTIEITPIQSINFDERKGLSIYYNDICRLEFIKNALQLKKKK